LITDIMRQQELVGCKIRHHDPKAVSQPHAESSHQLVDEWEQINTERFIRMQLLLRGERPAKTQKVDDWVKSYYILYILLTDQRRCKALVHSACFLKSSSLVL
jgi:hypothetical protein